MLKTDCESLRRPHSWTGYRWAGNAEGYLVTHMICQHCLAVRDLFSKEPSGEVGKITDPPSPEVDRISKEKPPVIGLENILKKHKAEV